MASKKALVGVSNDEDRISCLPDGVLCHILSFLPTKYSVRTGVLSSRWKHLFTFVPNLDFEFPSRNTSSSSSNSFIQFVNSVFILYNVSRMMKFRFYFSHYGQPPKHCLIVPWIYAAIRRHVQEIDICVDLSLPTMLPCDLFSCQTLTILRVRGRFIVDLPRSVCLPCLKTCDFQSVCFNHESAKRFFRSCPALECLDLTRCRVGQGVDFLDISVPSLKHLIIYEHGYSHQLVFNLPNLLYFYYMGPLENGYSGLESFKSVVNVCICYEGESYARDAGVVELVRAISHAQRLYLSCDSMEAFLRLGHSLPTFNNLNCLSLGTMSSLSSRLLPGLLDNSPQLEFLEFNRGYGNQQDGADQDSYLLPEHVPVCVSNHVKEIEFSCDSMREYDFKLVEYFLKNASVLYKMKIQSQLSCRELLEIMKKVLAFPRCSTACKIVFESVGVEEV